MQPRRPGRLRRPGAAAAPAPAAANATTAATEGGPGEERSHGRDGISTGILEEF